MPGLLGKKLGMTSIYVGDRVVPVTVVEAGPCKVVDVKTKDKDGYEAVQLGYGSKKEKNVNKPMLGHFRKNNVEPAAVLREFKGFDLAEVKAGDTLTVEVFEIGEMVSVSSNSKGKGFQGVMRRHGFGGVGGTTHGQSNRLRAPGSIGQSSDPSRVLKGTRMAGRMGGKRVTTKGLRIIRIDPDKNILMIKGAIPGSINSIVEIKK
ncbi:MAG: 50S ribosomal protein L3 [Melioribacteraceae bacterium]|nr:MAG: 50S ribosomal protein L3 [Melioribacteraceae bacterium]